MSEKSIDLTDAVTPENPSTIKTVQKYAVIAATAATVVYLGVTGVKKFAERKNVTVTVADNTDS